MSPADERREKREMGEISHPPIIGYDEEFEMADMGTTLANETVTGREQSARPKAAQKNRCGHKRFCQKQHEL